MVKKKLILLCLFFALIFSPSISTYAQNGDPGDGGCDPLDPACPIDGGLTALLAVGVGYGIKKVRDARSENKEIT